MTITDSSKATPTAVSSCLGTLAGGSPDDSLKMQEPVSLLFYSFICYLSYSSPSLSPFPLNTNSTLPLEGRADKETTTNRLEFIFLCNLSLLYISETCHNDFFLSTLKLTLFCSLHLLIHIHISTSIIRLPYGW